MDIRKNELAEKVSILYYEKNMNQSEIARELEISKSYVSQLLSYAKEVGIVKVTINIDESRSRMIKKEIELRKKFPRVREFYIMSSDSEDFTDMNLGKFSAPYLFNMISESSVIGVNFGKSIEKAISNLESYSFINGGDKVVVQMMGGLSNFPATVHPNEIVRKLSAILNCPYYYLNCPIVVGKPELRLALMEEKNISSVASLWNEIDLAIMGIGTTAKGAKLFNSFTSSSVERVESAGVCGEINVNFYDGEGKYVPVLDDYKISVGTEVLSKIKKKVVIGSGQMKKEAILGALRGGLMDVLITDSITIEAVEKHMEEEKL